MIAKPKASVLTIYREDRITGNRIVLRTFNGRSSKEREAARLAVIHLRELWERLGFIVYCE